MAEVHGTVNYMPALSLWASNARTVEDQPAQEQRAVLVEHTSSFVLRSLTACVVAAQAL